MKSKLRNPRIHNTVADALIKVEDEKEKKKLSQRAMKRGKMD
jgi:hypothetical protein